MSSVFMIQYGVDSDSYYGKDWYISEDYGFFTSREDAEARIRKLDEERYERYLKHFANGYYISGQIYFRDPKTYEDKVAEYTQALAEWEVLWAAGIQKPEPIRPIKPVPKTFDEWMNNNVEYEVLEVEPGDLN